MRISRAASKSQALYTVKKTIMRVGESWFSVFVVDSHRSLNSHNIA